MPLAIRGDFGRNKQQLFNQFGPTLILYLGNCEEVCVGCGALRWRLEGTKRDQKKKGPIFFSNCCHHGEITLPSHYSDPVPEYIEYLLTSVEPCLSFIG